MAVLLRISNTNKCGVLGRLKTLIKTHSPMQSFHSPTPPKEATEDRLSPEKDSDSALQGHIDASKWKTLDARELGVTRSKISHPSWMVLNHLQLKGFKSYLVGGCVRDLLLNRTPKDFDVITTADLSEVRKHLRRVARAQVVGRRFPVCLVHVKGSVVEVSSFETVARTSKGKEKFRYTILPKFSDKEDLTRCKNSLHRDFTINSLFYDPFANKIYDYANGMADLRSLKLDTVIPAQLSFKEDPGRILRGFRIAARLGLSLSRETEAAILTCSSLVKSLDKSRIMVELNYMLSYGAAEPSLRLLWKFNLLGFLLPVHAAYLDEQANKEDAEASNMLMKLFLHLDSLVACDRPSDCTLWIGLLAFHLALVNNPQDALVVGTLASVLYHGEWEAGVKFARGRAETCVNFPREIRRSSLYESDEEIAEAVTKLASLVMDSIPILVENNSLFQSMSRYPSSPCSGIVFVSRKTGRLVSEIFKVLVNNVQSYRSKRKGYEINYDMLGKGELSETRHVLGKIVLDTMSSGVVGDGKDFEAERCHLKTESTKEIGQLRLSDPVNHHFVARKEKRRALSTPNPENRQGKIKKQKLVENGQVPQQKVATRNHDELFEKFKRKETSEEREKRVKLSQKVDPPMTKDSVPKWEKFQTKLINNRRKTTVASKSSSDQAKRSKMVEHKSLTSSQSTVSKNHQELADNCDTNVDAKTAKNSDLKSKNLHLSTDQEVLKEKERQKPHKSKRSDAPLSSLFK